MIKYSHNFWQRTKKKIKVFARFNNGKSDDRDDIMIFLKYTTIEINNLFMKFLDLYKIFWNSFLEKNMERIPWSDFGI